MLSLKQIIQAVDGKSDIEYLELSPSGVSTDTRTIEQGELFVALLGETFDGHDFIEDAFRKGAIAAIVSKDVHLPRVIKVADTLKALGEVARFHRNTFNIPLLLISGTNGKTTVKNLTSSILSAKYKTYANPGNFNNLIGLPLSILEINNTHELAVLEAGISKKGELSRLAEIAKPTCGLLTNVGPGHLENLVSLEGVFEAKWELARNVKNSGGTMYLNADYDEFLRLARKENINYRTFGIQANAEFKPLNVRYGIDGTRFFIKDQEFHLPLLGAGNLSNAIGAIAVSVGEFGTTLPEASAILTGVKPEKWRLEHRVIGKAHFLIDCYNANPTSMRESLSLLTLFPEPRIAVLGAMLELGADSEYYHKTILELAKDTADLVIVTGPYSECYPKQEGVLYIEDKHAAAEELRKRLLADTSVLLKGSRSCKLEDIISELGGII